MKDDPRLRLVLAGTYAQYRAWLEEHGLSVEDYYFIPNTIEALKARARLQGVPSVLPVFRVGEWQTSRALTEVERYVLSGWWRWADEAEYPERGEP